MSKSIRLINQKFHEVGFPKRYVEAVIRDFRHDECEEVLIPSWLFEDRPTKYIRLPFCENNEHVSKVFLQRLNIFTNDKFIFKIIWETRKIRSLLPLKDKVTHKSSVIYQGICSCGEKYIGETVRLAEIRFREHDNPKKTSEASKHLRNKPNHQFEWEIITSASRSLLKRKILEAFYIAKFKPGINDQLESHKLLLFRNGIT